jgi:hypothetical protein
LDQLFAENLVYESTEKIIEELKLNLQRVRAEEEAQRRNAQAPPANNTASDSEEEEGPDQEYVE